MSVVVVMTIKDQKVLGENFLQIEDYVKHKRGSDGLDTLKEGCSYDFDDVLAGKFYPFEDYVDLLSSVKDIMKDDSFAYNIGHHRARTLLLTKGIKNYGFDILTKLTSAWRGFNNFGEISVKQHGPRKVTLIIRNYESHPLFCERMRGFFTGLMADSNMESCTIKEIHCVCKGHKVCEYLFEIIE